MATAILVAPAILLIPASSVSATTPSPLGYIDTHLLSNATNSVTMTGWTLDPSHRSTPNSVQFTVDGAVSGGWQVAGRSRTDINRLFVATGGHGFSVVVPLTAGRHTVCLVARPVTTTTPTTRLGCWAYQVNARATQAQMVAIAKTIDPRGTINWIWTPSTTFTGYAQPWYGRIQISSSANTAQYLRAVMLHEWSHVLQYRAFGGIDGWWDAVGAFNALLGDTGDQLNYNGLEHGADCIALALGADYLGYGCPAALKVFGARIARGTMMNKPQGVLDSVTVRGSLVTVKGWSADPANPTRSNAVQITDNGRVVSAWSTTSLSRTDVNAATGVTGNHGFQLTVARSPGSHRICVSAKSLSTGAAPVVLAGCTTVTTR